MLVERLAGRVIGRLIAAVCIIRVHGTHVPLEQREFFRIRPRTLGRTGQRHGILPDILHLTITLSPPTRWQRTIVAQPSADVISSNRSVWSPEILISCVSTEAA